MALGFKSPRVETNSSLALSIANATALTEQMQSFLGDIEDPRVARSRADILLPSRSKNTYLNEPRRREVREERR